MELSAFVFVILAFFLGVLIEGIFKDEEIAELNKEIGFYRAHNHYIYRKEENHGI